MYRDNSLVPLEAVRTAALGALAGTTMRYAELAEDIRRFTSQIVGPSLDLMGSSIQILRAEGLIASVDADEVNPKLRLTERGHIELMRLLGAGIGPASSQVNRLVVALKMRFLHLLSRADQSAQTALLAEHVEGERERFEALPASAGSQFDAWRRFEIEILDRRLTWLHDFAGPIKRDADRP